MEKGRNNTFDETTLAECAHTIGYDLARAIAVVSNAFTCGIADGFADMAAPADGVELVNDDTEEEPHIKTDIRDCRECWCDTCAKLESCQRRRDGARPNGIQPFPCIGCFNGMRFMPRAGAACEEYEEIEGYNNG